MTNLLWVATNLVLAMTNAYFVGDDMMTSGWSVTAQSIAEIRLHKGGTMTRPIETVRVVTNVTTASNESGCQICSANPGLIPAVFHGGGFQPCAPYKPATEKTETTEIIEIKTLRFSWNGQDYALEQRKVLSTKTRKWVRKDNWEESP